MGGHPPCSRTDVEHDSVALKIRVILVTTRAALRHAEDHPERRAEVVNRGRALIHQLRAEVPSDSQPAIDRAMAELDRLVEA